MVLLIGFGNTLRRDDGAGPVLAHMIAESWEKKDLRVIIAHQLAPELAKDLGDPEVTAVVFMDAAVDVSADDIDGLVRGIEPVSTSGTPSRSAFGHHFPPEELLAYAKVLYGSHVPAWLVTIPGADFGFGDGLSHETAALLPDLAEKVLSLLRHLQGE